MKRVLILCAVILTAQPTVHAEGPRVGIISDAASRKEADLLMVELQKATSEVNKPAPGVSPTTPVVSAPKGK